MCFKPIYSLLRYMYHTIIVLKFVVSTFHVKGHVIIIFIIIIIIFIVSIIMINDDDLFQCLNSFVAQGYHVNVSII
jgi:hypothetical protein